MDVQELIENALNRGLIDEQEAKELMELSFDEVKDTLNSYEIPETRTPREFLMHKQGAAQPKGRWIRTEKRLAIYLRDGFGCVYCGKSLRGAAPSNVTLDHLLPKSAGGSNDATNLVTACKSCNCSRQDKPWADYATGGAVDRIEQLRVSPLNIALARALIAGTAGDEALERVRG